MIIIGMLDSPFVRRVAISADWLGLAFEHQSLSVFSMFEEFQSINPQVKAPTVVLDSGLQLMDSSLILDYAETMAPQSRSLMSTDPMQRALDLHILGVALAVAEKTVQLVYERNLRPVTKQHDPWLHRVTGQLQAGCRRLNMLCQDRAGLLTEATLTQAWLTTAVVWRCMQELVPEQISAQRFPALQQLSAEAESLPVFQRYPPTGPGVVAPAES